MGELPPIVLSLLAGLLSGFVVQMPVGPINVTIINEGARRGFFWALMIGLGGAAMEVIYCTIAFAGFATFFDSKVIKAIMELLSFVLMVFLGFHYLFVHSVKTHTHTADVMEEKWHPHSAFMIGFLRVLGNPGVLLLWITLAGAFASHEWIEGTWRSRAVCITGVGIGAAIWFGLLSYTVSLKHKQLSTNTLVRMAHISGIFLLAIAAMIGVRIVWMLYRYH